MAKKILPQAMPIMPKAGKIGGPAVKKAAPKAMPAIKGKKAC